MKLLVPFSYITFLFFSFANVNAQAPSYDVETDYLLNYGKSPIDYVISTFDDYQVVMLAEDHAVKEHVDFISSLIPALYQNGIRVLCMEFGAVEMQGRLDKLLNSSVYDEQEAREMFFYYNVGWAYQEYHDIYRAAWSLNHSLSEKDEKFRIINLSYRYNWSAFDGSRTPVSMSKVFYHGCPDAFRAKVVEKEVLSLGKKALIYMGGAHLYTTYKEVVLDMNKEKLYRFDDGFMGNRLERKYPGKFFNIVLHYPFNAISGTHPTLVSPADGAIEAIFERMGNKPVGFDLAGTPLGELPDHSFLSIGYDDFRMKDFFNGYIFFKPFKMLTGCTVDEDFFDEVPWNDIAPQQPDPYWHRAESLAEYCKQISDFVDLKKRYSDLISVSIPTPESGHIDRLQLFPSQFVQPRNVDVWLPDDYDMDRKYSVLYMHDGQMLFDDSITWNNQEWGVDETVSFLIKSKKIKDVIVVGIWNNAEWRNSEYYPQKPAEALSGFYYSELIQKPLSGKLQGDAYLKFLVQELKPYIDNHYSTYTDAAHTYVAGSSMGGLISMYALCEYPHVFGGAACISTHWTGFTDVSDTRPYSTAFVNYFKDHLPDAHSHKLYFDHGTIGLDASYSNSQKQIDRVLQDAGWSSYEWNTRVFEGDDHSENSWKKRLAIPLTFLLGY